MRALLIAFGLLFSASVVAKSLTPDQLLQRIRDEKTTEQRLMSEREQRFLADKNEQQKLFQEAKAALKKQELEAAELKARFEAQERLLAEKEQELKTRMGEMGELFAVIRQSAGDIAAQWDDSLLNVQFPERVSTLERLASSRKLPTVEDIEGFWLAVLEDLAASGRVEQITLPVVQANGERIDDSVVRIGPFMALNQQGILSYEPETDYLLVLPKQPSGEVSAARSWIQSTADVDFVAVDPTRGSLMEKLQRQPSLWEQAKQGKIVGAVIMALGVLGLLFAIWRFVVLMKVLAGVRKQMRNLSEPTRDNPLGRVLSVLGKQPEMSDLDSLELKLDEAVMREVPNLEFGHGMLKLIAAVAPLLGLLGTVVGMIVTFQSMNQAGGADSRLMADGISLALVTTVQGLIVAVPMLFLHSVLAARTKSVVQLLEQQCVGMLALYMAGKDDRD